MSEENSKLSMTLISEAKNGNQKSFARLVTLYADTVYTLLFRFSMSPVYASEQTKIVFRFVRQNIFQVRMNIPMAEWLHGIVINHFLKEYHNRLASEEFKDFKEPVHEIQKAQGDLSAFDSCLYQLSTFERILIILADLKHYTMEEIHDIIPAFSETELAQATQQARSRLIGELKK